MFDEIKDMIQQLDEDELKSLLFQFFVRMKMVEDGKGYSEEQFFLDSKNTYYNLIENRKRQENEKQAQYHSTHIVFGDSPSGSLKMALKEIEYHQLENIINVSDLFSIGPIWNLHDTEGIQYRYKWLSTHINIDDEVLFRFEEDYKQMLSTIDQIPSYHPIIIWAGENAHEQTGLRFVLYLLKEKMNDIFIINTNEAYQAHFAKPESDFIPRSMGELSSQQVKQMYENKKNLHKLTRTERLAFEQQWLHLCNTKEVLRIWDNHHIMSVPDTYYDAYIIQTVEKLHQEKGYTSFIKLGRVIGEIIGHLDQYVGDQFIEYRVRRLIVDGIFDMEGVPKAMRYYSIKIR